MSDDRLIRLDRLRGTSLAAVALLGTVQSAKSIAADAVIWWALLNTLSWFAMQLVGPPLVSRLRKAR